jgi:Pyruvate/2-oxoacid:ferredoxin oxidoreductase delta subunit
MYFLWNCSTIAKWELTFSYAENIVRSSCVGCGICAAVCPRVMVKMTPADQFERNFRK